MKKYLELEISVEKLNMDDVLNVSLQDGYDDNELPLVGVK
jgi:hypothetical protein